MRDHHFYIIVALLLLILYCMMNHSRRYSEGFYPHDELEKQMREEFEKRRQQDKQKALEKWNREHGH